MKETVKSETVKNITTNNTDANKQNYKKDPLMRRIFDAFGNMFGLNICFILGCLPIFTIGASLTATYAMAIRIQEGEEETVFAGYIHEFKRSFKQATLAFLAVVAALVVFAGQYIFIQNYSGAIAAFYTVFLMMEVAVFALIVPFMFPLIARYENKLFTTMKNAFFLSLTYLGSWIKFVTAWVVPIALNITEPIIFIYIWYLWLLLLFGAIIYGTSTTMRKIFRLNETRNINAAEKAKEEADKTTDDDASVEVKSTEDKTTKKDSKKNSKKQTKKSISGSITKANKALDKIEKK